VNDFKQTHLPEELPFVYIDAYHCSIKDAREEDEGTQGTVKKSSHIYCYRA
jgi:hypothetical protein